MIKKDYSTITLLTKIIKKKKKIVFKNIKETLDTIYFNSCLLHIQKFLLESEFLNQTPNKMMFEYFYDILTTNTNIFFFLSWIELFSIFGLIRWDK